jgi:hypothetical protein
MRCISKSTNTNRREQASGVKKYSFTISNLTATMQIQIQDESIHSEQSQINEFQVTLKHLETIQKALAKTSYRFEAITSAMYVTSMDSAMLQISEYAQALKTAKPETSKRLSEISDMLAILYGLFDNTFTAGTLFMNGYLMQERMNLELKSQVNEQQKKITMLEAQLSRK